MSTNMTTNTVALVTGASSGIGRETAQLLAEHDARTFGTVRDLRRASLIDRVELIEMNVNDDGSVREAVRSVLEKAGKIDVLINNAGDSLAGGLEETSVEEARQLFETNFFGVLRVTQAVPPSMRRNGYGRIVNISSMLGLCPDLTAGFALRANMRSKVIRLRWIMKSEPSVFGRCWSNRCTQRPKSRRTKKAFKPLFRPTPTKNSE